MIVDNIIISFVMNQTAFAPSTIKPMHSKAIIIHGTITALIMVA